MPVSDVDAKISSLVDITDAILRGDFDQDVSEVFDAQGVLSTLTQKINTMVINMKTVEAPLSSAGEYAPSVVSSAHSVIELMSQSTEEVLNKSDKLTGIADKLETFLLSSEVQGSDVVQEMMPAVKSAIYDIIASQSFQDVARQKMESLIKELNQMRDWLVESLVVLNINKDVTSENLLKKKELLKEAKTTEPDEPLSQDLVDDLLAEFGL